VLTVFFAAFAAVVLLSLALDALNLAHLERAGGRVPNELADSVEP
jgi:hypothetical protein